MDLDFCPSGLAAWGEGDQSPVSAHKLSRLQVGGIDTLRSSAATIYSLINGSTLQDNMVRDATNKDTNDEPVTPRKIPLDHTKLNTSDKLKSEMV